MTTGLTAGGRRLLAAVLLASWLSGCEWLPLSLPGEEPPPAEPPPPPALAEPLPLEENVAGVLMLYRLYGEWEEPRLREALQTLSGRLEPGRCEPARISAGLVAVNLPSGAAPADLLDPCLPAGGAAASEEPDPLAQLKRNLALLLRDMLRLRATQAEARREVQQLRSGLSEAAEENARLRKQVESLKAIEQSLQQRDRGPANGN